MCYGIAESNSPRDRDPPDASQHHHYCLRTRGTFTIYKLGLQNKYLRGAGMNRTHNTYTIQYRTQHIPKYPC